MKYFYLFTRVCISVFILFSSAYSGFAQDCSSLKATYSSIESRCTATGVISINATGGSGNYNYKVIGPVTTSFTSANSINGLAAGNYAVFVHDINTGCTIEKDSIKVGGSYSDPRFLLTKTDVTCMNGHDGTVSVSNPQFGRSPFIYTIMAPSPSGVGISNTTGVFTNLVSGEYVIQLKDSCGGQQTRRITVLNYTWWIDSATIAKISCDSAAVSVTVTDSKGNVNNAAIGFSGFIYGVARGAGDTVWSTKNNFHFSLGNKRAVTVVVKDPCGNKQYFNWTNNIIPAVAANVTISAQACVSFTATVTGQTNLTNPQYSLYNAGNVLVSSNTTGVFTSVAYGSYCIKIQDNCYDTTISRCFVASRLAPSVAANVTISNQGCTTFSATVTGQTNLSTPTYNLYNSANALVASNNSGAFNNINYGSYCIKIQNTTACYDTLISRCFTVNRPVPSVAANVTINGQSCTTFSATITGQTNLNNPTYCLYTNTNLLISCNTSGIFNNINYGSYCIKIQNSTTCYDTLITRCFNVARPIPSVGSNVTISNQTCTSFTATITGQTNLNTPTYCIYTSANVLIACNNSGVFNNLAYGSYCIKMQNSVACFDTLITRCFSVTRPVPAVAANVTISNKGCTTFTATVTGQSNLTTPTYNLFNGSNVLVVSNTTGVFNSLAYGSYCIKIVNTCYDTTISRCFVAARSIPTGGSVTISNKVCSSFTASVTGQANLNNPTYSLVDASNNVVATNTTGVFNTVAYGSYCIRIQDPCYDTTISRCFVAAPNPITVSIVTAKSCSIGNSDITVTFNSGSAPYKVQLFSPSGALISTVSSATSPVVLSAVPGLPAGLKYKIKGIDNCNVADSQQIAPLASTFIKSKTNTSKCPTASWQNGATDITINVSSNLGSVTPTIISKNGVAVTINYSNFSGTTYQFIDLEPATYIMAYNIQNCSGKVFDTISVAPYSFPGLQKSAAFQCDNNSFSVGASITGGSSPFNYEIIGSTPKAPSIVAPSQSNAVFSINNGTQYSLVRLRAVDACGNATLNDVNILPLANTIISASSNCFYNNIMLQVDTMPNATYTWYHKISATDSIMMGNGANYNIPYLMPTDTGTYIAKMSVNGGCLTKESSFRLNGSCGVELAVPVVLSGKLLNENQTALSWSAAKENGIVEFIVERSTSQNGAYLSIGTVQSLQASGNNTYQFRDNEPLAGINYYRLKMVNIAGKISYSNVISLKVLAGHSVSIFPNPVKDVLNIHIMSAEKENYLLTLFNAAGQKIYESRENSIQQATVKIQRDGNMKPGVYILQVTATNSGAKNTYKVLFE